MTLGLVELGGTKTLVAAGTTLDDMSDPVRIDTTDPDTTLASVIRALQGSEPDAVGIASFGPLELRPDHPAHGTITHTPKTGWEMTPVLATIRDSLEVPVRIETDVNAAALGEGRWGAARGMSDFVYVTVGTGIGGGAVAGGELIGGPGGHPEMGHVPVRRHDSDDYPGRCAYHGDCLEGLASGPALADRFGEWPDWGPPAVGLAVHYLAQALRAMVYLFAPQRIVVGGGVSKAAGFHDSLQRALVDQLAGYPDGPGTGSDFVVAPGLGDRSALAGCLLVARMGG